MKSDERNLLYDRPGRPPNIGWDWLRKAVIKASEEMAQGERERSVFERDKRGARSSTRL